MISGNKNLTERRRRAQASAIVKGSTSGFTLVELMAALMILVFGITAVIGGFSTGISTEQQGELVRDAARLANAVQEKLLNEGGLGLASEAVPDPVRGASLLDHRYLVYDLDYQEDRILEARLLVTLTVRWLRRGEAAREEFKFFLPRGRSLAQRIEAQR